MIVLVTGATGFVGREVLRQLILAGHRARFLARRPHSVRSRALSEEFSAEVIPGDLREPATLESAFQGIDAVVHLVGIISEAGTQTYERVHVEGTRCVIKAAKAAGARRFLHMSALGTRPGATARYHRTKWEAEEWVRASGLQWTIFRPSLIYGAEDHFVNLFASLARWSPVLPVMGSGRGLLQPVSVENVAQAFARAVGDTRAVGKTFDLCGPRPLAFVDVLDAILNATHRRRWKLRVPLAMARLQAEFFEWVFPKLRGRPPPLNRDQLIMLEEDNVGDPQPAKELFHLVPEDFHAGLARMLKPA